MPPPNAGNVVLEVAGAPGSRLPFIILLAIIFLAPIYFAPQYWWVGAGGFALVVVAYIFGSRFDEAKEKISYVCDNGLVIAKAGAEEFIPWTKLDTISTPSPTDDWNSVYQVNVGERHFQIGYSTKTARNREIAETIAKRAPLEWIGDMLAVRPENAAKTRAAFDKLKASVS